MAATCSTSSADMRRPCGTLPAGLGGAAAAGAAGVRGDGPADTAMPTTTTTTWTMMMMMMVMVMMIISSHTQRRGDVKSRGMRRGRGCARRYCEQSRSNVVTAAAHVCLTCCPRRRCSPRGARISHRDVHARHRHRRLLRRLHSDRGHLARMGKPHRWHRAVGRHRAVGWRRPAPLHHAVRRRHVWAAVAGHPRHGHGHHAATNSVCDGRVSEHRRAGLLLLWLRRLLQRRGQRRRHTCRASGTRHDARPGNAGQRRLRTTRRRSVCTSTAQWHDIQQHASTHSDTQSEGSQ
jgi:hypothetical protein